jgi:hypothetical protein
MDVKDRFSNLILDLLSFTDLSSRCDHISQAHNNTFQWLFLDESQQEDRTSWDNFASWLACTDGPQICWLAGKSGSGKSTLMKFITSSNATVEHLEPWGMQQPLVQANHFFWNPGTIMQRSREGLLRSLPLPSLQSDLPTLLKVFENRWQQFLECGGGRQPFAWSELRDSFEIMISNPVMPRRFFFVIDGLDEFDGDSEELVDFIMSTTRYPHVKMCVSSRPWNVFAEKFHGLPSLRLERLNRNDIHGYVASSFASNKSYARLIQYESTLSAHLIREITDGSTGVFLWVHLVVLSLLKGMANRDTISQVKRNLKEIPYDLEAYYAHMLEKLEPVYFKSACQLFRVVVNYERLLLLELSFAEHEDDGVASRNKDRNLTLEHTAQLLDIMYRRLTARCGDFLEIERETSSNLVLSRGW